MSRKGKFVVFEGIDGSGKTTQVKLLVNYLRKHKISHSSIYFPSHDNSWGGMVRRYLVGEFGSVGDVSPYLASTIYAGDRLLVSNKIRKWIDAGKLVVCDRYIGSNLAHMAGKIKSKDEKIKFVDWLEEFEYKENKIPREDLVIYLSMPADISQKLMKTRRLDIHERDVSYLSKVARLFDDILKKKNYWVRVNNAIGDKLREPFDIHKEIVDILKRKKFL